MHDFAPFPLKWALIKTLVNPPSAPSRSRFGVARQGGWGAKLSG
jgi:hypothetical protein